MARMQEASMGLVLVAGYVVIVIGTAAEGLRQWWMYREFRAQEAPEKSGKRQ